MLPGAMRCTTRCTVCDLAWELRMSERQFFDRYGPGEREQLMATFMSLADRAAVRSHFGLRAPGPRNKPKGHGQRKR